MPKSAIHIISKFIFITLLIGYSNVLISQNQEFNFGFETHLNFYQIEGDGLRGFNKVSPGIGLIGGYNFSDRSTFVFNPHYDKIGSNLASESLSQIRGSVFGESDISRIGLTVGYALRFGDTWTGNFPFKVLAGFKYNRILSNKISLISNTISVDEVDKPTFKKTFGSLVFGFGRKLSQHIFLDLEYEHALKNILNENAYFSRYLPFGISLRLSYTI